MFLVQLLIPIHDNDGNPFPRAMFDLVRQELTEAHGGVTAFVRSPAQGCWKDADTEVVRDDVVMYEVMTAGARPGMVAALPAGPAAAVQAGRDGGPQPVDKFVRLEHERRRPVAPRSIEAQLQPAVFAQR